MATNNMEKSNATSEKLTEKDLIAIPLSDLLNTSLGSEIRRQVSASSIEDLTREISINGTSEDNLSRYFFKHPSTLATRAENGVVETPKTMAAFMVKLAYSRWCTVRSSSPPRPSSCHWFDPCCGGGVFLIEILRFYIFDLGVLDPDELPKITMSEISDTGVLTTLVNLAVFLESVGISAISFLNLDKVRIHKGDTLMRFSEEGDTYSERVEFDIVIGNPPYVRAAALDYSYKNRLKEKFPKVFSGAGDLYSYFVSSGVASLRENGVLTFISPASFTRAKNGTALRNWLLENASLDTLVDLDETRVFKDADLHASIYVIRRGVESSRRAQFCHVETKDELHRLQTGEGSFSDVIFSAERGSGWSFHSSVESLERFKRTFLNCTSMIDFGINVYSGIRTGCAAAFVLNPDQYNKLSREARDRWVRPLVLPSDILRWSGKRKLSYLIVIPSTCKEIDEEIESILLPHKSQLQKRSEIIGDKMWFTLRACRYYDEMEKEKIVFPDLSSKQRFSLVEKMVYVPDGAYFINTSDLVILGILNSSLAKEYFVNRCASVGSLSAKGRFRFKKEFVKRFPLPKNCFKSGLHQDSIRKTVSSIIKNGETGRAIQKIDYHVQRLYEEQL